MLKILSPSLRHFTLLRFAMALAFGATLVAFSPAVEAQGPCVITGQPASRVAARYRAIATIVDATPLAELDTIRARMGIPRLDSSAVALVSDTSVCYAALTAYVAHTGLQGIGDSVVVVALGPTRYLVSQTQPLDGESKLRIVVFDTAFTAVRFSEKW